MERWVAARVRCSPARCSRVWRARCLTAREGARGGRFGGGVRVGTLFGVDEGGGDEEGVAAGVAGAVAGVADDESVGAGDGGGELE